MFSLLWPTSGGPADPHPPTRGGCDGLSDFRPKVTSRIGAESDPPRGLSLNRSLKPDGDTKPNKNDDNGLRPSLPTAEHMFYFTRENKQSCNYKKIPKMQQITNRFQASQSNRASNTFRDPHGLHHLIITETVSFPGPPIEQS